MNPKRKIFVNDRVKALISLCFIMGLTILLVFLGIEYLKKIPYFSASKKEYLDQLNYPPSFKLLVVLIWGALSVISAFLLVSFQYAGFINRIGCFFEDVSKKDNGQMFHFRKNDSPSIIKPSLENLLHHYRNQLEEQNQYLYKIKNDLLSKIQ